MPIPSSGPNMKMKISPLKNNVKAELNTPNSVQAHKNLLLLILFLNRTPTKAETPAVKKNKALPTATKDESIVKFLNTISAPTLLKFMYHDRVPALIRDMERSLPPEIPIPFVGKLN